jgi:hypothetical protein
MLPQPPPNAPAPPPSDAAIQSRIKWNWLVGAGSLSIFGLFVLLTIPMTVRSYKNTDQTEAVSNARQIGLALFEFDAEYGKFPDATTIAAVQKKTGSPLPLGTKTSNDMFRQLLASDIVQSEQMFYAFVQGGRKPDGVISPASALEKGECGFSYLAGLSSTGNPSRPLVVTPLIPGTDRFDPKRFDGKAIILRMDNSVTSVNIEKNGHVLLDGRNLLDPKHPIWSGAPPTIVWPE